MCNLHIFVIQNFCISKYVSGEYFMCNLRSLQRARVSLDTGSLGQQASWTETNPHKSRLSDFLTDKLYPASTPDGQNCQIKCNINQMWNLNQLELAIQWMNWLEIGENPDKLILSVGGKKWKNLDRLLTSCERRLCLYFPISLLPRLCQMVENQSMHDCTSAVGVISDSKIEI